MKRILNNIKVYLLQNYDRNDVIPFFIVVIFLVLPITLLLHSYFNNSIFEIIAEKLIWPINSYKWFFHILIISMLVNKINFLFFVSNPMNSALLLVFNYIAVGLIIGYNIFPKIKLTLILAYLLIVVVLLFFDLIILCIKDSIDDKCDGHYFSRCVFSIFFLFSGEIYFVVFWITGFYDVFYTYIYERTYILETLIYGFDVANNSLFNSKIFLIGLLFFIYLTLFGLLCAYESLCLLYKVLKNGGWF